jgi:hypothetical protein
MGRVFGLCPFFGATMDPKKKCIHRIKKLAESVNPLAHHGETPGLERSHKTGQNYPKGNGQAYLVRRIARDHPDILERMKADEFEYVRQATIAAGIVKSKTKPQNGRRAVNVIKEGVQAGVEETA